MKRVAVALVAALAALGLARTPLGRRAAELVRDRLGRSPDHAFASEGVAAAGVPHDSAEAPPRGEESPGTSAPAL